VIGLAFVLSYLVDRSNTLVNDAAGVVWQTRSIAEASATVSIYTMIFMASLAAVKLLQGSAEVPIVSVEPEADATTVQRDRLLMVK
jgi:hypothetical protein